MIKVNIPLISNAAFWTDSLTPTLLSIVSGLVVIILSKVIPYIVKSSKYPWVSSFIKSFGRSIINLLSHSLRLLLYSSCIIWEIIEKSDIFFCNEK